MKKVIIGLISLFWFYNLSAQEPLRFGAVAGININEMSGGNSGKDQIGFHLGAKAELPFSNNFFLDGELLFIQKGYKTAKGEYMIDCEKHTMDSSLKSYYLQLPIYVGYKINLNQDITIFGGLGGYLGMGLFGKEKSHYDGISGSQKLYKDGNDNQRFDCGIGVKVGVEIIKKVQISGGYEWGLINTKKHTSYSYKHRNAIISCAYLF